TLSKGRGAAFPALLGRTSVQRHALGRHAARRPLRRHGAAGAVRRGSAELLPNGAVRRGCYAVRLLAVRRFGRGTWPPNSQQPSSLRANSLLALFWRRSFDQGAPSALR